MNDLLLRISDEYDRYKKAFIDASLGFKAGLRAALSGRGIETRLMTPFIIDHYKLQNNVLEGRYSCSDIFGVPDIMRLRLAASHDPDNGRIFETLVNGYDVISTEETGPGSVRLVLELEPPALKKMLMKIEIASPVEPPPPADEPFQGYDTLKTINGRIGSVKYLDDSICEAASAVLCESFVYMYEKEKLDFLGIGTFAELADMLALYRDRIIDFAIALLRQVPSKSLVEGISVMYLYYLLLAETGEKARIVDFMNIGLKHKADAAHRLEMEKFADRLLSLRK